MELNSSSQCRPRAGLGTRLNALCHPSQSAREAMPSPSAAHAMVMQRSRLHCPSIRHAGLVARYLEASSKYPHLLSITCKSHDSCESHCSERQCQGFQVFLRSAGRVDCVYFRSPTVRLQAPSGYPSVGASMGAEAPAFTLSLCVGSLERPLGCRLSS